VGLILGALAITPAWAQAGVPQAALAAAQSLYDQATAEMNAGHYASACPNLEEATRLVPEGLGAKLTLAACYVGQGRLASAWSQYALVAVMARPMGQPERAQRADEQAAALKSRLAMLTVSVPMAARAIPGLSVTRDGIPLGEGQWGVPVPLDTGHHEVVVTAPGHTPWKAQLDVKTDGEQAALEVQAPAPEPPKASDPVAVLPQRVPVEPPVAPGAARAWQRPTAIAGMGLGLAGLGIGAVLGGMALANNSESNEDHCNTQNRCDGTGLDLRERAVGLGNGSTIALMAGGVLAAGGVVLWITAPDAKDERRQSAAQRRSARLLLVPGYAQVRGEW
jgi:hypothetical protein